MDPEQRIAKLEQRVEDLMEIAEENNHLLHSMRTTLRWSFWGRLLIWIIVLALPFLFLGHILKAVVPGLPSGQDKSLFGLPSTNQVKALLDAYKSGSGTPSSVSGK